MTAEAESRSPISAGEQIRLLLEAGAEADVSISQVAQATGISDQALANLLQGKSANPRLSTLLALCRHYGISLDYFACESETACRAYLYRHQMAASSLIGEIENAAAHLSPKGQRNVLAIMEWMRLAVPAAR